MSTLGNTTTPTYGWDEYTASANQAAQGYTMPSGGGTITAVSFYGSGDGGSTNKAYGCIWNGAGTLLAAGSGVNTSGGSRSGGGQAWHTDTLTSSIFVAGGVTIYIGWQRSTATTFDWSWAGDGASVKYKSSGSTPSNWGSSATVQNGSIGSYATYTAGGGGGGGGGTGPRLSRSGHWTAPTWKRRKSGAWVAVTWKRRHTASGGSWTTLS